MTFLEWLVLLTAGVFVVAALVTLATRLEEAWCRRHPRLCSLCRSHPRRAGDVLCWTCTRLLRRYPRTEARS